MKDINVVITQPMYFPWAGFFELIKFADICVFYDDVQYPRRHFVNRVQLRDSKTSINWLSVPLIKTDRSTLIKDMKIDNDQEWRNTHINKVKLYLRELPFSSTSLELIKSILSKSHEDLIGITTDSITKLSDAIGLAKNVEFLYSSELSIKGSSSKRLFDICKKLNANNYITAHGAKNYLDHNLFESQGISVKYINYDFRSWNQAFPEFTPFVSILDPIASVGEEKVAGCLNSNLIDWKKFI
tara:strand:+ start:270 stop:995 length:726 start_codon:yes stop_codon:yes gene_type:complete